MIGASSPRAQSQTLGPDFAAAYTADNLSFVPGVPSPYGGIQFKEGSPNKLLVVGQAEALAAAIYEIDVTRDATGHVNGFAGTAAWLANCPEASGGLTYGPGGVLLYTTYSSNTLGQIKPGSTGPDKVVDLTALGVAPSTGGLAITPSGFPGAGKLRITTYDGGNWYDADLVPDGAGTFDVNNVVLGVNLGGGGSESVEHVDSSYPAFSVQSVLIANWDDEAVYAYELDGSGDPVLATERVFLECCAYFYMGSTTDAQTGDFLFADWDSGDMVTVVKFSADWIGTNYCGPANLNSSGQSGVMAAWGFEVVAANSVRLDAAQLPANQWGMFVNSMTQGFVNPPGSQGNLCLGGAIGRYKQDIKNSGAGGQFSVQLDLTQTPTPGGPVAIQPGETWHFQAWYRDLNPGATSNFTDGLTILFQ